jgi:hypothetical protein
LAKTKIWYNIPGHATSLMLLRHIYSKRQCCYAFPLSLKLPVFAALGGRDMFR